jgi:RNA polymerase sigma factor (sigma-70 family)
MKKLSQREQDLIEAKYFYDKKLKDISAEFNISQSRISRIIQNGLEKIKKDLLEQEKLDENYI